MLLKNENPNICGTGGKRVNLGTNICKCWDTYLIGRLPAKKTDLNDISRDQHNKGLQRPK